MVADRHQIHLERGAKDYQLLLTLDVYDENRQHIAMLRRNSWVFNHDGYQINTNPRSLTLSDASGGTVVLAEVVGLDHVRVNQGSFYTRAGDHIEITPSEVILNSTITFSGNYFQATGGIRLSPMGFVAI